MYNFLKQLNPQQYKAATTVNGPVSILAGAGSGKTKTLIARTAYILAENLCQGNNILVMTFTNKAAREMRERGQKLLEEINYKSNSMPDFTTFHSWGVRFLKSMPVELLVKYNLKKKYSIIDNAEQLNFIKKIAIAVYTKEEIETIKINDFLLPFTNIQNNLVPYNNAEETFKKLKELRDEQKLSALNDLNIENDYLLHKFSILFVEYKALLRKNNCIDFDDLINIPIQILSDYPTIKEKYKNHYKYVMIDEFQDTNYAQIVLMNLLLSEIQNICVVGDDSQSIYSWRGADISYILNFHKDYREVAFINLNINYRSSQEIVARANQLLTRATQKHELKQTLEAFSQEQGNVEAYFFRNEELLFKNSDNEAKFIARKIKSILQSGVKPGEVAVLYRMGLINRKIEIELIAERIPYKIHGGRALLDRKVAQTLISYLKFLLNNDNDIALESMLVGSGILSDKRALSFLYAANSAGVGLYEFINQELYKKEKRVTDTIKNDLEKIKGEINKFKDLLEGSYKGFITKFFKQNIVSYYCNKECISKNTNIQAKALSELRVIGVLESLLIRYDSLEEALEVLMLEGQEEDKELGKVNLMTIHSSKGLEFEHVFVAGLSKGIFPNAKSISFREIEEERRLAYVAFTRAKHGLYLTGANNYFAGNRHFDSEYFGEAGVDIVFK